MSECLCYTKRQLDVKLRMFIIDFVEQVERDRTPGSIVNIYKPYGFLGAVEQSKKDLRIDYIGIN